MSKQTEEEFVDGFESGMARMVARECYRAIHPGGMHTNGPTLVTIEVSRLLYILHRWKHQPAQETKVVCSQCGGKRTFGGVPCSACNAMGESTVLNREVTP